MEHLKNKMKNKNSTRLLNTNEVIQLNPETCRNPMFKGCFMVVTEPRDWGAQGYIQGIGSDEKPAGQAYYRAIWEEIEYTNGMAPFVIGYTVKEV